jgi:Uma2 family endonuclease
MNKQVTIAAGTAVTSGLAQLAGRSWSTAELVAMAEAGAFDAKDRFELIRGEVVPMSPKGIRHEIVRNRLGKLLTRIAPEALMVAQEAQFNLAPNTYTDPDILVHSDTLQTPYVRGDQALLVIEVSVSSLDRDLTTKADLYASFGVAEYWVIDAWPLLTKVHREPIDGRYRDVRQVAGDETLVPLQVPELAVTLGTLKLD